MHYYYTILLKTQHVVYRILFVIVFSETTNFNCNIATVCFALTFGIEVSAYALFNLLQIH